MKKIYPTNTKAQEKEYFVLLALGIIFISFQPIIGNNVVLQLISILLAIYIFFRGIKLFKNINTFRKNEMDKKKGW